MFPIGNGPRVLCVSIGLSLDGGIDPVTKCADQALASHSSALERRAVDAVHRYFAALIFSNEKVALIFHNFARPL